MARLNIPESIKEGLSYLATLTDEQYQELYSALENIPLRIKRARILDDSGLELTTIPSNKFSLIKDALFPLYISQDLSKEGDDLTPQTLVDDVAESLKEWDSDKRSEYSDEDISRLKERLNQLLSINRVKLIIKANDILTEHARTYTSARIFSDIRPVFGEKVDDLPQSAVIVHMLKITHLKDRKHQEFVVALDARDIQQLIGILERAKQKAETLHSIISSANMNLIDVV